MTCYYDQGLVYVVVFKINITVSLFHLENTPMDLFTNVKQVLDLKNLDVLKDYIKQHFYLLKILIRAQFHADC